MELKNKKYIVLKITTILFFVSIILCIVCPILIKDYKDNLITALKEQERIKVEDIFSFEFDRAYIFDDYYARGEDLNRKYNLGLSIEEVEAGDHEDVQRIVFVDESGEFVYEFRCKMSEVLFLETGLIIYPETIIENKAEGKMSLVISFKSSDYYNLTGGSN